MAITPATWNVIVLGNWNTAILTPSGIAKRLFKLESGTPVEVHVALDIIGPLRVIYGDIAVMPSRTRLVVEPTNNGQNLAKAMNIACNALEDLPETPFSAVGINIRYTVTDPEAPFLELLGHDLDNAIASIGKKPTKRRISRTIEYKEGVVNIEVSQSDAESYQIEFNYHKDSNLQTELLRWLKMDSTEIQKYAIEFIEKVFKLSSEEELSE